MKPVVVAAQLEHSSIAGKNMVFILYFLLYLCHSGVSHL